MIDEAFRSVVQSKAKLAARNRGRAHLTPQRDRHALRVVAAASPRQPVESLDTPCDPENLAENDEINVASQPVG